MSYLLDRRNKRKNLARALILLILFALVFYFRGPVGMVISSISHTLFRPVLSANNAFGRGLGNIKIFFTSKESLVKDNEDLKNRLLEAQNLLLSRNLVAEENESLKEILSRKGESDDLVLSAILSKPNQSPYDTIIIDVGSEKGVREGNLVFVLGNIPVGRVREAHANSSKVVLFSTPGEKTEVSVGEANVFMEIVGRGGGNFEITMPRDFSLPPGSLVVLPGMNAYVVAKVETIISDPRDSFAKAILASPVNIQELRFVQVRR